MTTSNNLHALLVYSTDSLLGLAIAAISDEQCVCKTSLPDKVENLAEVIYIGSIPNQQTIESLVSKNIVVHVYDPTNYITFSHEKLYKFGNADVISHVVIEKIMNNIYLIECILTSQFKDYKSDIFELTQVQCSDFLAAFIFLVDFQQSPTEKKLNLIKELVNKISFYDEVSKYQLAGQTIRKIKQDNMKSSKSNAIEVNIHEHSVTAIPIAIDLFQSHIEEFIDSTKINTEFVLFYKFAIFNQMPGYLLHVYNVSSNISASLLLDKYVIAYENSHKYFKTWVNSGIFHNILPHISQVIKVILPQKNKQHTKN